MRPDPTAVVEQYLRCLVDHDWEGLADLCSPDVVRVGPFSDTYTPRRAYLDFISALLPTLRAYELRPGRITAQGNVVVAQLTESMEIGGVDTETREALVVDIGDDGLIQRIEIYIQRPR